MNTISKRDELFDKQEWMFLAYKESLKSEYRHKLGCVIIKSGKSIISRGYNQLRYKRLGIKFRAFPESLHAEVDAITKVHRNNLVGSTLYVYREDANGNPVLSMPCENCLALIEWVGIRKVIYSTNEYPYYKEMKI